MVTVGIDPHKHVHVAVAVGADGRRIGKPLTVKNDGLLIPALLRWVRSITNGMAITWAIEDGRGFARRLADGLLLAGHEVVGVPTRLAAAHRKLHATAGAKSDLIDAIATAHAAIATPGLDRHRIDERVRELRVLVDYRTDLIKRRTELPPVRRTADLRSPVIIRKDVPHARTTPSGVPAPRGRAGASGRQTADPAREGPGDQPLVPAELDGPGRRR
jgi:hypothetical protein